MPRIPWGTPTLSDSDKLEWAICDNFDVDDLVAQLKLVEQWTDDFSTPGDFGHLTEVDTGANVEVSGGKLKIKGGAGFNNGAYLTTLLSWSTPFTISLKCTPRDSGRIVIGPNDAAGLDSTPTLPNIYGWPDNMYTRFASILQHDAKGLDVGTEYTIDIEYGPAQGCCVVYVTGGDYTSKMCLIAYEIPIANATVGLQIIAYNISTQWEIDDITLSRGYDTGGEYMQFSADAGAGQVFAGLDFSSMALPSGLTGTNLRYQYSYDDGTPSYNGSWLTLAQLQAVGAVAGNHRYIRLRVQLNSDGDTQEYGAAVNADDGITSISDGASGLPVSIGGGLIGA